MFSKTESYAACNYPWQSFLSIGFSQLKWVRLKTALSSAAELVPNFSEFLSWHIKTHWTNSVCHASTWSSLCQDLLAESEHIEECIHTIWISNFQNTQWKKTFFIYGTGNHHIMLWYLVIDLIIWSLQHMKINQLEEKDETQRIPRTRHTKSQSKEKGACFCTAENRTWNAAYRYGRRTKCLSLTMKPDPSQLWCS